MIESGALEQAFASLEVSRPPAAPTAALAAAGAGNVENGVHKVKITFKTATGETLGGAESAAVTVVDKSSDGKIAVSAIPVGPAGCTDRGVYMTKAGGTDFFHVADVGDNTTTTYTIDVADAALTVPEPVRDTAYATLAQPVAGDGIRHNELQLTAKLNREPSAQKRGTPDVAQSLPRRSTANWNLGSALWEPSGTLGTASYLGKLLKAAFGAQTTPNLSTTVSGGASTTGATLTTTGAVEVGDCVVATVGTASHREITRVKTLSEGNAITFDALSLAPDTPGAVVSGVNYKFASTILDTLTICLFHTGGGFQQAIEGAIVDRVEFRFDGTREVQVVMSGPGRRLVRTGFSIPASHTTSGSPASGLVGGFFLAGEEFLISQATVAFENNEVLRNIEMGTSYASGHMRGGRRRVTTSCAFYLEDTSVLAAAEGVTTQALRLLVGQKNGAMVGIVAPKVEWEIPDVPTTDGPKILTANGVAYATSGNDELFAAEA